MKTGSVVVILTIVALAACSPQAPAAGSNTALPGNTAAPASSAAPANTAAPAASAAPGSTAAPAATSAPASAGNTLHFVLVPGSSQAQFKVKEQLANRNLPNDAIGTTSAITGELTVGPDGTVVADGSHFSVDLRTLQSDESRRDQFVQRNTLETGQYPSADFVAREVRGFPSPAPASGTATFQLIGDLSIHGVTKPVTWDVTVTFDGAQLSGTATTNVKFEDFGMAPPRAFVVLSVEDNIGLQLDFHMQKSEPPSATK